jgi:hypothetical protein
MALRRRVKVERSPRRLLNALAKRMGALPADVRAFGDSCVFGEADPPAGDPPAATEDRLLTMMLLQAVSAC